MQVGAFTGGDVSSIISRVVVNGVQRSCVSWDVQRELSGDLPEQIVAVSGIKQATGTVVWSEGADVEGGGRNPWNPSTGWLPAKGDRVVIYEGDGTNEYVQFYGRIDKTTGSIGEGFQSVLIDDYDKLSASVSHLPLLRIMPPLANGDQYRGVGLSSIHYVDDALRTAGFYSTPPTESNPAVAVTCQGSMWPNNGTAGTLQAGGAYTGTASHHSNNTAPWGWSVGNFNNTYTPRAPQLPAIPVQLTAMVAPDHTGSFFLTAYYGPSNTVQLAVGTTRTAILRVNGTEACRVQMGAGVVVTALLKNGAVTIKTNLGASASGSAAIGGTIMTSVLTSGDEPTRIAGIQVSHPTAIAREFASLAWTPSAVLDLSNVTLTGLMDAGRAIDNERADDLLGEISEATLSGMWIDETGVFRWAPTLALTSRPVTQTVTTLNDILSLDWEDSVLGSRSKVTVTAKNPVVSKSTFRTKELYRGSGETLGSKEISEDVVGPGADEDWIMPDESMTVLNPAPWSIYNGATETLGGVFYSSSGETITGDGLTTTITMEKIGINQYKIKHVAGAFPADVTANLATSPTAGQLWPRNRDKPLPVIKGFGKVQWVEATISPVTAGGIGPELVHDARIWNSRTDDNEWLSRIADYLSAQTATPKPTITGLEVTPDPRRQLGDVIRLESPDLMGVTMTALIVDRRKAGSAGGHTETLAVRIQSAVSQFTTFAEYNASMPGTQLTFQQWDALGPKPQTFAEFNTYQ